MKKIYSESNTEEQNEGVSNAIEKINKELPEIMENMSKLSTQLILLCNSFPIHSKVDSRIMTTSRKLGRMGHKIGEMNTDLKAYYHQKNGRNDGFWYTDHENNNW